jgi:hypothetical protein
MTELVPPSVKRFVDGIKDDRRVMRVTMSVSVREKRKKERKVTMNKSDFSRILA